MSDLMYQEPHPVRVALSLTESIEVDGYHCGVPGLAVTPVQKDHAGWTVTHVASGRQAVPDYVESWREAVARCVDASKAFPVNFDRTYEELLADGYALLMVREWQRAW